MSPTPDQIDFHITSGVSSRTGDGFVQILIHAADWSVTIRPAEAQELAHNLLAAAEAAQSDANIVAFARSQDWDDQSIATLLITLRNSRPK